MIPEVLQKQSKELEQYYEKHFPLLAPLARQCFLSTIETTVQELEDGSPFVITGDIPAMWLRDSAAQVRHYIRYAAEDTALSAIIEGIIAKQAEYVLIDPYANAFNEAANDRGHKDDTERGPWIWERKYEVDSLCAPLYLAYAYWKKTGSIKMFDDTFRAMITTVCDTFRTEQDHRNSSYYFRRSDCVKSDTLPMDGYGRPVNVTGMTWSGFRPSDDCCTFGYLVPSNMMAVCALSYAAEIAREVYSDSELQQRCESLRDEIQDGINTYGIVDHPRYGKIYAYETDGFGNFNLMDDANSPSLLAAPYLDYCAAEDPVYRNTRAFVLSADNPYYFEGKYASGVGSPHTADGMVWHIGITMQALTSCDREEIIRCLTMLGNTHAGTNFMHEGVQVNDPEDYTRPWFAWANSLFAELLIRLKEQEFFA